MSATVTPVDELPSGTVTLLFADVEGSTRLLNLLGARFGPARARMRELVREAAREHGGAEVDWAGDGVFLAFPRARDAVAAAARIHCSLADEPWPDEEAHRLRIGLHTGEPELGDEGYVGIDVVIASRICAAAHGEQVVVSQATRDVSGSEPVPGASYRPLGRHRLKDVPATVQLFQLVAPGLRQDFPPLTTLTATSLPALHHRLVGRGDALARVEGTLEHGARLVTITGPGGAGKSRLALEVAARAALDRPVHLVGLAPIADANLLPSTIARAIGARESSGRSVLDSVADALHGTGTLLYLDNLEHLAGAATYVADLVDRSPDLQVLATSRTPLRLSTEHVLPLEPLAVADAMTLFIELAAARGVLLQDEALASVREICRRLDGLPLAIELVAARLVVLPPAEILRALGEGLALDMEGPVDLPERQRTLRAAIEWSYHRLAESQRALHETLAVFSGGASLDDARALAGSPPAFLADLEAIVGWSLVRSESSDGELRLSMLETVREHALARLRERGELEEARSRHAEHFFALARSAEKELEGHDQGRWLERLETELDNLRAALGWSFSSGKVEAGLRATTSLHRFWRGRGHVSEGRRWLSLGLTLTEGAAPDVRARALWTAAHLADAQSDWGAAVPLLEEALTLFREAGCGREASFALAELGFVALVQGDPERAEALCEEALALGRSQGDSRATSAALNNLGEVCSAEGDHERALRCHEEAVALRRTLGDPELISASTYSLGVAAFRSGDIRRARAAFEESLAISRSLGESLHTAAQLFMLAELDLLSGALDTAEQAIREALAIYASLENDHDVAACLVVLAGIAVARESYELACLLLGAAGAVRGDTPLEQAERTVLERFQPELARAIGPEESAVLQARGAVLGYVALLSEVVSADAQE